MEPKNISPKIILPAFILCTLLGVFGAHRFYAGKPASAIVILLLTISFVGTIISVVWVFIDWVIILCGAFRDGDNLLISKWVN